MSGPGQRTLLFVGGGIETIPGVEIAKRMGLRVAVSDRNPQAPCFSVADFALIADTYDGSATLAAARKHIAAHGPIHGVLCLASDVPYTVATVALGLNLKGITTESAALVMDKLAMKDRFRGRGVAVPWYAPVDSVETLRGFIASRGYPLVIKPVDSRGARGVLRLTVDVDPEWAFDYALGYSPSKRVMVEQFLDGPQVSTESLVVEGVVYTPGFSDRNYSLLETYAPHIIEDGGDLPSFLPPEAQAEIKHLVAAGAAALDVRDGVVKGDIVYHQGRAYIIELALRLSGGHFCTYEIPLNTGVPFVEAAIRQALGESPGPAMLTPKFQRYVCQRYLFPKPGRVISVDGGGLAADPKIAYHEIRVLPGDVIPRATSHPARAGLVIAVGEDRDSAQKNAQSAIDAVKIITEPE